MRDTIRDAFHALRILQRQPGFALVAIGTIALGIGANTVIFSVVNGVLLQPLPFPNADQLHLVWKTEQETGERINASYPEIQEWTAALSFESQIAGIGFETYDLTGATEPEQIRAASVDVNFFAVMGVSPSAGRPFITADRADGDNLLVLTRIVDTSIRTGPQHPQQHNPTQWTTIHRRRDHAAGIYLSEFCGRMGSCIGSLKHNGSEPGSGSHCRSQ